MRKITLSLCVLLTATLFSLSNNAKGQTMSYSGTPLSYVKNTKITPIEPSFTGGTTEYGTVTTLLFILEDSTTSTNAGQFQGLACDAATKTLYLASRYDRKVKKADLSTASPYAITTIAGSGVSGTADGDPGTTAEFKYPYDIYLKSGKLFVSDNGAYKLKVIDLTSGTSGVTTYAGIGTAGTTDGPVATAKLADPGGIAMDDEGNLYYGQTYFNTIRIIDAAGENISTLKDNGGDNIVFDKTIAGIRYFDGYLYVSEDNVGQCIKKVNLATKEVTVLAGSGTAGFADGQGLNAQFNKPSRINIDPLGNVFVADYNNNRIRKIAPDGMVTTVAGDGTKASKDGQGATAQFSFPVSVALDGTGYLYCNDAQTGRIRKVSVVDFPGTTYSISPALPAGLSFNTNLGIISGTPTASSAAQDYIITATTKDDQTFTATVNIEVSPFTNTIREKSNDEDINVQVRNGHIEITGVLGENTFAIVYNLQGMPLKEFRLGNNRTNQIDVTDLSKGIYLLNLQNANNFRFNKKIIVN